MENKNNKKEVWQSLFGLIVFGGGMVAFIYVVGSALFSDNKEYDRAVDRLQKCYDSARSLDDQLECESRFSNSL